MRRRQFLSDLARYGFVAATGATACSATGCGAFMYSERCGQLHSNQIDWKVVALDSLGLLLFFVPGIVAFIVDFYTGAIYLPVAEAYPGYAAYGRWPANPSASGELLAARPSATAAMPTAIYDGPLSPEFGLKRLPISGSSLRRDEIEQVVSRHVGRPISLSDARTRVSVMERAAQFDEQASRHRADANFGFDARPILDRLTQG